VCACECVCVRAKRSLFKSEARSSFGLIAKASELLEIVIRNLLWGMITKLHTFFVSKALFGGLCDYKNGQLHKSEKTSFINVTFENTFL
jgi:hypothetical protein